MNKNNSYTEREIIDGIIAENDDVLLYIYKNSFRPVRHLITTNSGNEEDARDIFQEALVILYKKLKSNNLRLYCSVSTFIYSIARLLWLKELKKRGKEVNQAKKKGGEKEKKASNKRKKGEKERGWTKVSLRNTGNIIPPYL